MNHKVVHFEIGCPDIRKSSEFYSAVFQWELTLQGKSAKINTSKSDSLTGHLNQLGPNEPENYVTIYIETDDIARNVRAIVENGGSIVVQPLKLSDGRSFAWFKDIGGNVIGLITRIEK